MGVMFPCPTCAKELTTKRGMRQHHTKVHDEPLPNLTCKGCGSEFYHTKADRSYCPGCSPNAGEHNPNWKDANETAQCKLCTSEFEYYPSDKDGVYCPDCVRNAVGLLPEDPDRETNLVEVECSYCKETLHVYSHRLESAVHGVFCTPECHAEWLSTNIVGERHHQWQGGEIRYGAAWWRIRRQARERDGHTCQICSRSVDELGKEPDVHHIVPVREFDHPKDAHRLDNVICLCRPCHQRVEGGSLELPSSPRDT